MSTIRICDRCGCTIPEGQGVWSATSAVIARDPKTLWTPRFNDLCKTCLEKMFIPVSRPRPEFHDGDGDTVVHHTGLTKVQL